MSDLICYFRKSHFWPNSDLDVEAVRQDNLCHLAVCSWCFSLPFHSFSQQFSIFWDLFLIFLAHCLRAIRQPSLCCGTHGVIRCWILGVLVQGAQTSRGFFTTYWQTSSWEGLKSLQMLLSILCPGGATIGVSVKPGISSLLPPPFFFYNDQVENTETGIPRATLKKFALCFSSPPWSITGMAITQ